MKPTTVEFSRPIDPDALRARVGQPLTGEATEAEREALARRYGVPAVLSLSYTLTPSALGEDGWRFTGTVEARLTQTCVVTLEPVETSLLESIDRRFVPASTLPPVPEGGELEFDADADDGPDGYEDAIDLGEVAAETAALAIDPYPRRDDATFEGVLAAPSGAEPLTDEAARPFAGLAALKGRLSRS
jgi:hypothetical protein